MMVCVDCSMLIFFLVLWDASNSPSASVCDLIEQQCMAEQELERCRRACHERALVDLAAAQSVREAAEAYAAASEDNQASAEDPPSRQNIEAVQDIPVEEMDQNTDIVEPSDAITGAVDSSTPASFPVHDLETDAMEPSTRDAETQADNHTVEPMGK